MAKKVQARKWLAPLAAMIFGLIAMAPILGAPSRYKFGPNISGAGSDSYGFLYYIWLHAQPADGIIRTDTRDLITNYPEGELLPVITSIPAWIAIHLGTIGLTPALAYNIVAYLSFVAAFLLIYALVRQMKLPRAFAFFAAFSLGLSPYQILQTVDHIDLAATWSLLAVLYCAYQLLVARRARWLSGLALSSALTIFCHPYFFIMAVILNIFFFSTAIWLWKIGSLKPKARDLQLFGAASALGIGLVLYWRHLFTSTSIGGQAPVVERSLSDLYTYSTKFWDFLLPPHYSLAFSQWTNPIKYKQTAEAGTNFIENTLYPGSVTLLTLLALLFFTIFRFADVKKVFCANKALIGFLTAIVLVPIFFSISPTLEIFDINMPTPTLALYQIINQFRTMSRFGYITDVGLVLTATFALYHIFQWLKIKDFLQTSILIILAIVSMLDTGVFHTRFYSDTQAVPEVYHAFRDSSDRDSLLLELPYMWGYVTWFWESYHHRRNFGRFAAESKNHQLLTSVNRTNLNEWILFSRAQGITHLMIHSQNRMSIPGATEFKNNPKETDIFFLFAQYSYLLDLRNK